MQVGKTIYEQMLTLGKIEVWSWGSHAYKTFEEGQLSELGNHLGGLMFQVDGQLFKGKVFVTLSPDDTYKISFGTLRAGKLKLKNSIEGIYVENLVYAIDSEVETVPIRNISFIINTTTPIIIG